MRAKHNLPLGPHLLRKLRQRVAPWETPPLVEEVTFTLNPRLSRTLARCHPPAGVIELNPRLLEAPEPVLLEVLCHELAHVAAARSFGWDVQPHGSEWKTLVTLAGFEPRRTVPWPAPERRTAPPAAHSAAPLTQPQVDPKDGSMYESLPAVPRPGLGRDADPVPDAGLGPDTDRVPDADRGPEPVILYRHTCRVCHATRIARRTMRSWRCTGCTEAGLDGLLDIESFPKESAS